MHITSCESSRWNIFCQHYTADLISKPGSAFFQLLIFGLCTSLPVATHWSVWVTFHRTKLWISFSFNFTSHQSFWQCLPIELVFATNANILESAEILCSCGSSGIDSSCIHSHAPFLSSFLHSVAFLVITFWHIARSACYVAAVYYCNAWCSESSYSFRSSRLSSAFS